VGSVARTRGQAVAARHFGLHQALTDPDRYGDQYVRNLVGTLVPGAVASIAQSEDPVLREARTVMDTWRSRIPGLREGLHPKIDVWGQPTQNLGAYGPDVASRIYMSRITNDPVNLELMRLQQMPTALERKIRGVDLSDTQYEDYARTAGRMTKMQLDRLVNQASFAHWPDIAKRKAIESIVNGTRENARALMMMRYPVIWKTALEVKREEVHGATPEHLKAVRREPARAAP
jgi:hypothetical protein